MSSIQYIDAAGSYTCRVEKPTAGWFGESKEKGTPYIRVPLVVEDPESDQDGRRCIHEIYLTDNTIDRVSRDLKTTFGIEDIGTLESHGDDVPEGFAGMLCSIVTEIETYDGKERVRVRWLNPVDYKPSQIDKAKVGSIISRFGSRFRAVAKGVAGPKRVPESQANNDTDEIPF